MTLLEVEDLHAGYGTSVILHGLTFSVHEGQYMVVFGANGAGKSTLLRTLSGLTTVKRGNMRFSDMPLRGRKPRSIVRAGLSHVPEGRQVFPQLTVRENLVAGAAMLSKATASAAITEIEERLPVLQRLSRRLAGHLSGGEQQLLAIARALVARPRLLLLDEPTLGLAPKAIEDIYQLLSELNKRDNLTILCVEQSAHAALQVATHALVIENGKIVLQDEAGQVRHNEELIRAYIGV